MAKKRGVFFPLQHLDTQEGNITRPPTKGARVWGTLITTNCSVWELVSFRSFVSVFVHCSCRCLKISAGIQEGAKNLVEYVTVCSECEWQSLKCCAVFVVYGRGGVTPPRYCFELWTPDRPVPETHILLYRRHWSKDTECTKEAKAQPRPRTWHILHVNIYIYMYIST